MSPEALCPVLPCRRNGAELLNTRKNISTDPRKWLVNESRAHQAAKVPFTDHHLTETWRCSCGQHQDVCVDNWADYPVGRGHPRGLQKDKVAVCQSTVRMTMKRLESNNIPCRSQLLHFCEPFNQVLPERYWLHIIKAQKGHSRSSWASHKGKFSAFAKENIQELGEQRTHAEKDLTI